MGILDLLKEVPLSAVLREKIISLESENKSLKEENTVLKAKLEESEQQRRTLEQQVEQKLIESHGSRLDEVKEKIFTNLSKHSDLTEEQISGYLSISVQLAKFHLEELKKKGMVSDFYAMESPVYWSIDQNGRSYLFAHGLLV